MQTIDRIIQLVVSLFLIVGVYQFYFWCQRNPKLNADKANRAVNKPGA